MTTSNTMTPKPQDQTGGVAYTVGFVHANSAVELFPNVDSTRFSATGDAGISLQFNNSGGAKKILFDFSTNKTYSEDPAEPEYGLPIQITCNGDTVRDTLFFHPKKAMRKTAAYTLTGTGNRTIRFLSKKHGYPYNAGNYNFHKIQVYDAAVGGFLLNVPCTNDGGVITKSPDKLGYDAGETVHISLKKLDGYVFNGWSDGVGSEVLERDITMGTKDSTLTALFTPIDYDFSAPVTPAAGGTVRIVPEKAKYNVGDELTLTAVRTSTAYEFVKWSDGVTSATRTFTMPANSVTLTAEFRQLGTGATLFALSTVGGEVAATPRMTPATANRYFPGDVVDLKATPNEGYEFVRWIQVLNNGKDSVAVGSFGDSEYTVRFERAAIRLVAEFRLATGNPPVPAPQVKPVVRVDLNVSSRQEKEVNQPRYTPWVVTEAAMSDTFENVIVTMAKVGSAGTGIETGWYKTNMQTPNFAYLSADGIMVDGIVAGHPSSAAGGQISMTFSGLPKGTHNLLLHFNIWDVQDTNTFSPVDVYVNGTLQQQVVQTNRVLNDEASMAYLTVTARDYEDVEILMKANIENEPDIRNIYLCGFELNVPNSHKQARKPTPTDMDEHIDGDDGSVVLSWQGALDGVDSHDVYWGTDSASVASADRNSPLFRGTQTDTTFAISDIYCMDTYYWRIDQVKGEVTTPGNLWYFRPRLLAFPGAEGYGRYARGGRGGKVVYVTSLNDSGPGTLREATADNIGPRYILFAISGQMHLVPGKRITLNQPYVTVAGQTAPSKGICISGASYGISGARDAILRFLRVRVGQFGVTMDGMGMNDANHSILDHTSISWTHDESFSSRNGKNFTLQNTLIAEALGVSGHKNYPYGGNHGYAATIGGDTASFLRNLLAHCNGRNWSLGGGMDGDGFYSGHLDITNNVVYNYGGRVTDGGAHEVNFVNNYYKAGSSSTSGMLRAQHEKVGTGYQKYYYAGNVLEAYNNGNYGIFTCNGNDTPDNTGTGADGRHCGFSRTWAPEQVGNDSYYVPYRQDWSNVPFFANYANVLPAKHAFKNVISDNGASMPVLDEHDRRVILEARDGKWKYKGSYEGKQGQVDHHLDAGGYERYDTVLLNLDEFDTDRDGLPNWWEEEVSKTNPKGAVGDYTDTNTDPDRDGNTYMERYLEYMATPHLTTQKNRQVAVELSQYTLGYTKTPVYTVNSNGDGAVAIDGNWARFQPAADFTGVTYFEFKVTDSEGDSMVRKIGVRVQ
jgi:hypothetical protein